MAPTGWFDAGGGQLDYLTGSEGGAVAGETTFHLDGREYPCRVLSTLAIYVQLDDEAAAALAGDADLATLFRRIGVGRVRKDHSIPLTPPADRIWLQALEDDAVLVIRRENSPDHAAFFRLGPLSHGARRLGHTFGAIGVHFIHADDFLPDASFRHLQRIIELKHAWGAQIACTTDA